MDIKKFLKEFDELGACDEIKYLGKFICPWTPEGVAVYNQMKKMIKRHLK